MSRAMRRIALSALVGLAVAWGPRALAAQAGCEFGAGTGEYYQQALSQNQSITYIGTPHFVCADGVEIWADSAVAYSAQAMSHLIGNVRFVDRDRELRAREARYWSDQARLVATGDVFLRDVDGSIVENGELIYMRAASFRPQEQITVTTWLDAVRPRATLFMKAPEAPPDSFAADSVPAVDSVLSEPVAAVPAEPEAPSPFVVDGDRIDINGDSYFSARGHVEIVQDSLHAFADAADYDQVAGRILLVGAARVETATYDLAARSINLSMPNGTVREVRAIREAVLIGDELRLDAPLIQLFMVEGVLDRLVATPMNPDSLAPGDSAGISRPVALAEDFELRADSLDIEAPGESMKRIFAAGSARSVSRSRDSLNVESLHEIAHSDWLEGDTVIVTFLPPDTTAVPEDVQVSSDRPAGDRRRRDRTIDEIVAKVTARSLYRLVPSDSTSRPGIDPPAVHYVTGNEIRIRLLNGEVDHMEVRGQTRGIHLEPLAPMPLRDSLAVVDTAAARADTSRVRTDTARAAGTAAATSLAIGSTEATDGPRPSPGSDSRVREPVANTERRGRS